MMLISSPATPYDSGDDQLVVEYTQPVAQISEYTGQRTWKVQSIHLYSLP